MLAGAEHARSAFMSLTMKRHKRKNRSVSVPPSPTLPPEAQGVGWGILGVSGISSDLEEIVSGRSALEWYDQVLHVAGAIIVFGLLIGSLAQLVIKRW